MTDHDQRVWSDEQTLTAASGEDGDGLVSETGSVPEISIRAENPAGEMAQPMRQVARLEDVLKVQSSPRRELDQAQMPREVARLEQVLRIAPASDQATVTRPATPLAPAVEPAQVEREETAAAEVTASPVDKLDRPSVAEWLSTVPKYVSARALREAFWFELASAARVNEPEEASRELARAASAALDPDGDASADYLSNVVPALPEADAQPRVEGVVFEAPAPLPTPRRAQRGWLAALCLLGLVGLVVVLTGRKPRRLP